MRLVSCANGKASSTHSSGYSVAPGAAGNNRNACFSEDADYLIYLSQLRLLTARYECDVHAYCLMTNHVHLLLTPSHADACALLMRDLGRSYVPYFNRRHGRTGTLWEGRFRSCLTESERYVLACYRYIELNPVRAGMAKEPADYPWSSYRANSGADIDSLITMHPEFHALGNEEGSRHVAYRHLVEQGLESSMLKSIREATYGGYPLASDAFKSAYIEPAGWRTERGKPGPRAECARAMYDCEPT